MRPVSFSSGILVLALILLFSGSALSQMNGFQGHIAPRGVPASVTSFGFGGHPGFHGVPASVTSLGFGANSAFRGVPITVSPGFNGFHQGFHQRPFGFRHHRNNFFVFYSYSPFYGGYYAPYAYPYLADDEYTDDAPGYDSRTPRDYREYDDRRLLNEDYRNELNSSPEQPPQAASDRVSDQPTTVLIFKDGHQAEIANYAIVGATLYDLSDGRTKKVQLADLDLPATVKENDDRGVEFQLPAGSKLN